MANLISFDLSEREKNDFFDGQKVFFFNVGRYCNAYLSDEIFIEILNSYQFSCSRTFHLSLG